MASAATVELLIQAKDEASKVLKDVESKSGGLGDKLKALAPALAGVAAGFVSFKAAESAIDDTQALGMAVEKLRRETGLTAEDSSRLLFAFKHVGLDSDDASKSLGILDKKLKGIQDEETGVAKGGKSAAEILASIGIKAVDASGHIEPLNKLIPQIADKFKAMPDGIEKTGLAMQLFGRSGKDMIPLLNLGSAGMSELGAEADKLGVTLSSKNVDQIKQYTLAHRDMEEALSGIKLQIGLYLMPKLTEFAQWFTAHQPQIREFVSEALDKLTQVFGTLRDAIVEVAPTFESAFQTIAQGFAVIKPGLQWVLDNKAALSAAFVAIGIAAVLAFTPVTVPILATVAAIVGVLYVIGLLRQHWQEITGAVQHFMETHKALMVALAVVFPIFGLIALIVELVKHWDSVGDHLQALVPVVAFVFALIENNVRTAINVVRDVINIVMALINGDWAGAWNGIKKLAGDVWNGIKTAIGLEVDAIRAVLRLAWELLKGEAKAAWDSLRSFAVDTFTAIGKAIITALEDGIDAVIGGLWSKIEGIAGDIASKLNPANWFGSPKGMQNWFPYYFNLGMDNLKAAAMRSDVLRDVAHPASMFVPGAPSAAPGIPARAMTTQHFYIDNVTITGDAQAGLQALGMTL